MIGLIQLVTHARVRVAGNVIGAIEHGILALIGIEKTDTIQQAQTLIERIINYRIFADAAGKMNCSLKDVHGGLLLVPQFTLVADTRSGTRPGFSLGMPPEPSSLLFDQIVNYAKQHYPTVATGQFGANMQIELCNNGPATFILKTNE
ncbi:MAG: D-aminoacyl-tRNA deacylase [Gammaproteobacteria bacterium]